MKNFMKKMTAFVATVLVILPFQGWALTHVSATYVQYGNTEISPTTNIREVVSAPVRYVYTNSNPNTTIVSYTNSNVSNNPTRVVYTNNTYPYNTNTSDFDRVVTSQTSSQIVSSQTSVAYNPSTSQYTSTTYGSSQNNRSYNTSRVAYQSTSFGISRGPTTVVSSPRATIKSTQLASVVNTVTLPKLPQTGGGGKTTSGQTKIETEIVKSNAFTPSISSILYLIF